jgi:hypothetical protein
MQACTRNFFKMLHTETIYIPQKANKYYIKLLKLCMEKGHTWNFSVYSRKEENDTMSVSTKVVMELSHAWTIVTYNYYTSL